MTRLACLQNTYVGHTVLKPNSNDFFSDVLIHLSASALAFLRHRLRLARFAVSFSQALPVATQLDPETRARVITRADMSILIVYPNGASLAQVTHIESQPERDAPGQFIAIRPMATMDQKPFDLLRKWAEYQRHCFPFPSNIRVSSFSHPSFVFRPFIVLTHIRIDSFVRCFRSLPMARAFTATWMLAERTDIRRRPLTRVRLLENAGN